MTDLDKIWRKYATEAGCLERRPDFRFDPVHYGEWYPGLDQDPQNLAQHYQQHGANGEVEPTFYRMLRAQRSEIDDTLAELIIDPDLSEAMAAQQPGAFELAFELIHLGAPIDARMSDFSMSGYLVAHPDIAQAKVDPLYHYLMHGAREGRRTLADLRKSQYKGRQSYSPDRPTCLIMVHEFSRTGAPIVGADLAREAARTHNVVVAALRGGDLLDRFRDHACEVVVTDRPLTDFPLYSGAVFENIDFAIANSVECYAFVPLLVALDVPFASYIHEYAEYTFPHSKSTFSAVLTDFLVFSSEHVRNSWVGRLKDIEFDVENDSAVLPQRNMGIGAVDADTISSARMRLSHVIGRDIKDSKIICGAGHLQWRKGTDIFAMTAQISRHRDPEAVFIWIGDGLNFEDLGFGSWMKYHLDKMGAGQPESNLFLIPAGPQYEDVLAASDAMFVSSRLDPLPNVVFDALDHGCSIVQFEGASGFGDAVYQRSPYFNYVEYGNPEAAATALIDLPRKEPGSQSSQPRRPRLFEAIRKLLFDRLDRQRYFVRGSSEINVPMLFPSEPDDSPLRVREREKMLRYGRRLVWRDLEEVEQVVRGSENWIHRNFRLAPYGVAEAADVPDFSMHIHAYYTDELADDVARYRAYHHARRIVLTTDTEKKADEIRRVMGAEGLDPEVVLVSNRGRDILPFMELFHEDGAAGEDELWCHLHQKKSLSTTKSGDVWRRFLMRILLGGETELSSALTQIAQEDTGLVAPFDPYHIPWNASRALLPKFADRLPGPLPDNPLLFPVGNMFWVRRSVVLEMNDLFGEDYPWPNEPIANDGTEFHLIERLWPAMTTKLGLHSLFMHKLDEKRV